MSTVMATVVALVTTAGFSWPFGGDGWEYPINRHFEELVRGRYHTGVDVAAPCGTPVRAMADGEVVRAVTTDPDATGARRVVLRHRAIVGGQSDTIFVEYAHLRRVLVARGAVKAGQVVALSGRAGRGQGCHLHVAARRDEAPARGYERRRPGILGYVDPAELVRR